MKLLYLINLLLWNEFFLFYKRDIFYIIIVNLSFTVNHKAADTVSFERRYTVGGRRESIGACMVRRWGVYHYSLRRTWNESFTFYNVDTWQTQAEWGWNPLVHQSPHPVARKEATRSCAYQKNTWWGRRYFTVGPNHENSCPFFYSLPTKYIKHKNISCCPLWRGPICVFSFSGFISNTSIPILLHSVVLYSRRHESADTSIFILLLKIKSEKAKTKLNFQWVPLLIGL